MNLKNYPYLAHEDKRRLDMFPVSQIMSSPPEVVGPLEKASHLVGMLNKSSHNGFPVVHPRTKKFLGLVRRDQIIALLECGVFEEGPLTLSDNMASVTSASDLSALSTPRPGIGKSPLMHLAFHIKDDRFDHVKSANQAPKPMTENDIERFEWFRSVQKSVKSMPSDVALNLGDQLVPTAGDDSLPPLHRMVSLAGLTDQNKTSTQPKGQRLNNHHAQSSSSTTTSSSSVPIGFAQVRVNSMGNLVVDWLRPDCHHKYVNLMAVMNRGTFSVPAHMPLSNARLLFTKLGLRHVVVLGGDGGGQVVGVFTRANLMPSYIEAKTGVSF